MLQPFKHNMVWAFLAKKRRHQTLLYSCFSGKIEYLRYLRRYFNRITMSYKCKTFFSICLIKLYQTTMRKNFDFLFLTTLTKILVHMGNICSDIQGTWTSPRSIRFECHNKYFLVWTSSLVNKSIGWTLN